MTEQFANIMKRKNNDTENLDLKRQRTNHQSKGLSDILDHMSGGNENMKTNILAGVITMLSLKFILAKSAILDYKEMSGLKKN